MFLTDLHLQHFRCFTDYRIKPKPGINLVTGDNASGKSSLIEACYFLGRGQSFRAKSFRSIIQRDSTEALVTARADFSSNSAKATIGIETNEWPLGYRMRPNEILHRVNSQTIKRRIDLFDAVPIHLIGPDAILLIAGSPGIRRQFLDWGMFHVKHEARPVWTATRRLLKQRNAALRQQSSDALIDSLDEQFVALAKELTNYRRSYLAEFMPYFNETQQQLLAAESLSVHFEAGWNETNDFASQLQTARSTDRKRKLSSIGPQRAELRLSSHKKPLSQIFSRGQQKTTAIAFLLAQHQIIERYSDNNPVLLVDDLFAELDSKHSQRVLEIILQQAEQALITVIDSKPLLELPIAEVFHVKQ